MRSGVVKWRDRVVVATWWLPPEGGNWRGGRTDSAPTGVLPQRGRARIVLVCCRTRTHRAAESVRTDSPARTRTRRNLVYPHESNLAVDRHRPTVGTAGQEHPTERGPHFSDGSRGDDAVRRDGVVRHFQYSPSLSADAIDRRVPLSLSTSTDQDSGAELVGGRQGRPGWRVRGRISSAAGRKSWPQDQRAGARRYGRVRQLRRVTHTRAGKH